MTRTTFLLAAAAAASLSACSDSSSGGLVHGIEAGQDQQVTAGATALPNSVQWRLARGNDGRVTLRRVPEKALDLMVPRAYAQGGTIVKGSPVPGAVVCATDKDGLEPFVPCTNTDANGTATFFYNVTRTLAGTYKSEVRGTLDGQPAVFDTARAIVKAGPMNATQSFGLPPHQWSPATVRDVAASDVYLNPIPFKLIGDAHITIGSSEVGTVASRTFSFAESYIDSLPGQLEMRDATNTLLGYVCYRFFKDTPSGGTTPITSVGFHARGLAGAKGLDCP